MNRHRLVTKARKARVQGDGGSAMIEDRPALIAQALALGITPLVKSWPTETIKRKIAEKGGN